MWERTSLVRHAARSRHTRCTLTTVENLQRVGSKVLEEGNHLGEEEVLGHAEYLPGPLDQVVRLGEGPPGGDRVQQFGWAVRLAHGSQDGDVVHVLAVEAAGVVGAFVPVQCRLRQHPRPVVVPGLARRIAVQARGEQEQARQSGARLARARTHATSTLTIKSQLLHLPKQLLGPVPLQLQVPPTLQESLQVRIERLVHVVKDKLQA